MAPELKKIVDQSRRFWTGLSGRRRLALVGGLAGTLLVIGLLVSRTAPTSYTTMYSGLSPEDAGEIAAELSAMKVDYKLDHGGTAIGVAEQRVPEVRIALAQRGIPKGGGVGFEVFDKQSFGATSFVEQMNYRRALQGELQRSISSLDAVEAARVHLAMRERSLYRQDDQPPTASVLLKLRRGRSLSPPEVRGIVHLVASSIEGLSPERVTIVDESGRVLSTGDDSGDDDTRKHQLEQSLARRVEAILTPLVGEGHLEVSVTAELDRSQTERTEEAYDKDSLALRSESRTVEGSDSAVAGTAGGVAGARGNLPGAPPPTTAGATGGAGGLSRLSETKNYEVSKIVSRTIGPRERIKRLHVAVLVDGIAQGEGKKLKVVPRTDKELAHFESLAREAAGLDAERGDKIEVHSAAFVTGSPFDELAPTDVKAWPVSKPIVLGAGAGAIVLAVLATVLLMRRRSRRTTAVGQLVAGLPVRVSELEAQLPGGAAAAAAGGSLELPGRAPRERVLEAARSDTARAARVLSAWLSEPAEETGGSS